MTEFTPSFSFELIDFNIKPWSDKEHNNWSMLDRVLGTLSTRPELRGAWRNSTSYAVGDQALDTQTLVFYNALVANTSPASGSFSDYRTANPTHWQVVNQNVGTIRYDQNQVLSDPQKLQARTNIGAQLDQGFTAVQQGGGANQNTDKVRIGGNAAGPRIESAGTDFGKIWTDSQGAKVFSTNGYQKLPSGLILQWGIASGGNGSESVTLPIAFPTASLFIFASPLGTPASNELHSVDTQPNGLTGIFIYKRQISSGAVGNGTWSVYWLAGGY